MNACRCCWCCSCCSGAGLTYGAALHNLSEKEQLELTLYRCGDATAAYAAAKNIIVEYASGKAEISPIALDGAKSSLTYSIISGTANKPAAVSSQWGQGYTGVQADYTSWLLSQVDEVSAADALHALKVHLTPLFDATAVLVASSPAGKANELAISLGDAHWCEPLPVILEEELYTKFGVGGVKVTADEFGRPSPDATGAPLLPATTGTGKSVAGHGGAKSSGLSKQFKCECPKCDPAFAVKIAFGGKVPLS